MSDDPWERVDSAGTIVTARYRFVGGQSRTTVVRAGRDALVFSPGLPLAGRARAAVGDASRTWLIAPSAGHTLGIGAWREHVPDARVIAASATADRLRSRDVTDTHEPEALSQAVGDAVVVVEPPGNGLGEIWLGVEADAQMHWIVADAYMNLAALASGFWLRMAQRLYGLRPGLAFGRAFRSHLSDRTAYVTWLRQRLDPTTHHVLVPCHGEVDDGPRLHERLLAISGRGPD